MEHKSKWTNKGTPKGYKKIWTIVGVEMKNNIGITYFSIAVRGSWGQILAIECTPLN